jgi:AraC-like DNA-binding protein
VDGTVEQVGRLPAPPLRPFVARYSGYRHAGLPPGRHRGLPSPYVTFIVTLDDPLTLAAHPDPRQAPGRYDTLIGGLHTTPALIAHDGRGAGVQLALEPLGARALLGVPAGELANRDLDATDILGSLARELHERLATAPSWAARFAILDELLQRRASLDHAPAGEVVEAWRQLKTRGGRATIGGLAGRVGWSSRHLGERFRCETGVSPKIAARLMRFDRARRLLQRRVVGGSPPALADAAVGAGYYDQAHLAREFRALAGCSPSRWLAEELRFVQATLAGAGADWPHD